MWIAALAVLATLVVVLTWVLLSFRRSDIGLRESVEQLLDVIAEMDASYSDVQRESAQLAGDNQRLRVENDWHEQRERYFVDLYHAAHLLTEVFDQQKYDAIREMGIVGPNGWVPSKQGLDAIQMHLRNARDSVQAGRAALRQLIEWERDNPPPGSTVR